MEESDIKKDQVTELRSAGCFAFRFEDRFTSGIPDLFVCRKGRELWVEVKLSDHLLEPWRWKSFKMQQAEVARQLDRQSPGPVVFLCYSVKHRTHILASPSLVLEAARERVALKVIPAPGKGVIEMLQMLDKREVPCRS